jgi:TPR repeat protein
MLKLETPLLFVLLSITLVYAASPGQTDLVSTDPNLILSVINDANRGDPNAQCKLGGWYYKGDKFPKNYLKAFKWYQKAAEQGDANAQYHLGIMYTYGEGVLEDWSEGAKWFSKAAEQGNADAQCNLGYVYLNGRGLTQDFNEGVVWIKKAAERGHMASQNALAMMYCGVGYVPKDYNEAVKWFKRAAEQGCITAQLNLAVIYYEGAKYYEGLNVAKDYVEAYKWLLIAGIRDRHFEAKIKQELASKMTPDQIAEAEKRAKEFVVKKEIASDIDCSAND